MALHLWFTFALAYLATTLSPGPNVLLVIQNTLRHGARGTAVTLAGNLLSQLLVVALVCGGVGALLATLPGAFLVMKVVGAAYLIYLGVRQLFSRKSPGSAPASEQSLPPVSRSRIFLQAFFVSASNPKTLIFFSAFLPQFIEHSQPLLLQFAVMYLTIALIVCLVHSVYSFGTYRLGKRLAAGRWALALKRLSGALFVGLGVRLLQSKAV